MAEQIKSLNDFYNLLSTTPPRLSHQYQVLLFPPEELNGKAKSILNNVSYFCTSTNVPGRGIETADLTYFGMKFSIPRIIKLENSIRLSFWVDRDSMLRNALIDWSTVHVNLDRKTGIQNSNLGGIKTIPASSIELHLLNEQLNAVIEIYKLYGVFPTEIGNLELKQEGADILTFETTFVYQYYTIDNKTE